MVPFTRRRLLRSTGALGGALIAGCVSAPSASTGSSRPGTEPTATEGPTSASEHPTREGVRLGRSDVEIHPRRTVDFTDDVARLRCTCAGADAVREHVYGRVEVSRGVSVGCGRSPILATPIEETGFAVIVHHTTTYGRDGDLLAEPAVGYDRLRAVTPRTASATIESGDRDHACTVPVYVVREEAHAD